MIIEVDFVDPMSKKMESCSRNVKKWDGIEMGSVEFDDYMLIEARNAMANALGLREALRMGIKKVRVYYSLDDIMSCYEVL